MYKVKCQTFEKGHVHRIIECFVHSWYRRKASYRIDDSGVASVGELKEFLGIFFLRDRRDDLNINFLQTLRFGNRRKVFFLQDHLLQDYWGLLSEQITQFRNEAIKLLCLLRSKSTVTILGVHSFPEFDEVPLVDLLKTIFLLCAATVREMNMA